MSPETMVPSMSFKRLNYIDAQADQVILIMKKLMEDLLPLDVTPMEGKLLGKVKLEWRQYLAKITFCYQCGLLIHYSLRIQRILLIPKSSIELPNDPNMPKLEDIVYSDNDEDVGAEADMNNLDAFMPIGPILTTRIHKDHPVDQIIGDLNSRTKKVIQALKDLSWIEAMQDELLQFKLQKVWTLVDLPNGKRAVGTKWVYRNKKDERSIVIKNKVRLVAQGYTQEEEIDYDEVFSLVARIEAVRLFLAYASFKDFVVYQIDVKSAFLYERLQEARLCYKKQSAQKFEKMMHKKEFHRALWQEHYGNPKADLIFQVNPESSHFHVVKRIFRYLKGQPKLGIWYPKDSPFDLVALDSDYAGASLDRKSHWSAEILAASNCCRQNPVFHSKTKHIEIRHHFIRDSYEKKFIQMIKIHTDKNVAYLLTKAFDDIVKAKTVNGTYNASLVATKKWEKSHHKRYMLPLSLRDIRNMERERKDENVPTTSNDPLLSGEDRLKLTELMDLCKDRLFSRRVESFDEASLGDQEDASKQGRRIADIDDDAEVTLIDETTGRNDVKLLFATGVLDAAGKNFDREDLETLWKLVKAKHGSTRPEEGYERVL
ncbi:putative ribonuclease H-like domain-containing protein [Tanacetum coccineum]